MTDQPRPDPDQDDAERQGVPVTVTSDGERVVVVTPDGMGVSDHEDRPADDGRARPTNPADLVEQPAKVMRIGSMIKQLLDEVRSAPLDEKGRARLAEIHQRSIARARGRPGSRAGRGARAHHPAVLGRVALRRRAAHRPGPAGRVAGGPVPRHPDRARRAADGGPGAAAADAPAAARHGPRRDAVAGRSGDAAAGRPAGRAGARRGHRPVPLTPTFPPGAGSFDLRTTSVPVPR